MPPAQELIAPRPRVRAPALAVPRVAVRHRVALAVLALTGLTFLMPSAPTYDPWAWIIWGREILHLDLSTVDGPSWKPLPVMLTTPFALFGGAAPYLWLFAARAGAIAGIALAFRVVRRLGGGVVGGAAAAAAYAVAPWMLRNAALGNSEGLLVALALGAIERHLAGRARQAFALALGAALLRPEAWPFVGLYGLWLAWREPGARRLVIAGFVALPLLWLLPEWWGSGDLLRAAHRAHNPNANSAAFSDDPVSAVIDQYRFMLASPIWLGIFGAGVAILGRVPSRRERRAALALAAGAAVWVAEVAYMTNDGFSGNSRYLIMPAALACVLGGTGIGWVARALPARARHVVVVAALAGVAAFAFAQPWLDRLQPVRTSVEYQARLNQGLVTVLARAGGADRVRACGTPYTEAFQVPAVAYRLGLHTTQVKSASAPGDAPPAAPAVVFRVRNTGNSHVLPSIESLGGESGVRTLAIGGGWRIVGRCR